MKLLLYSHFFAPSIGGVETIVLSLARGLVELQDSQKAPQFEITLVTQTPADAFEDANLPFRVVRRPGALAIWRHIRSAELVHVAGPALLPMLFALLLRKPLTVEHHGFQTICPNGQLLIEKTATPCPGHFMAGRHQECLRCNSPQGWLASCRLWLLTFARRFLCSRVSANIAPTQWLTGLLKLPHATAIHHGLDLVEIRPRLESTPGKPVIAFLGRLVTTKGVNILLEAARLLLVQNRSFELLIIGDGPERPAMERFARESNLQGHIRFCGRLGAEELQAAFASATLFVVPSLGGEVFGLVVAESMARGFPVVASDLGAFVEVLGDTGLTFRTGDAEDLARVFSSLFDDPNLANSLAGRARLRAVNLFSGSRMIEGHASLYRQTLKRA